jgi:ribosomal protein S18 acetylase RimI-like enzyme
VRPEDWRAVKHLRLAALLDTPIAFCERWADAAALDDDAWRARAARGAEGGDSFQLMAWDGARPVATAVCFVEDERAWLAAVHVAPDLRGAGLLARLVDEAADWARSQGRDALHLEVHEDNPRARRAYAKLGFTETGRRRPYPLDPSSDELEMVLRLAGRHVPA